MPPPARPYTSDKIVEVKYLDSECSQKERDVVEKWLSDFSNISIPLYTPKEIRTLSSAQFQSWIKEITNNPERFSAMIGSFNKTWLSECFCFDHEHARYAAENRRERYEDKIILSLNPKQNTQNILSIGSGYLLQELILILRLIHKGFKSIRLDCIEIDNNMIQQEILSAIIARLNESIDLEIIVNHFTEIDNIEATIEYDSVYVIDFPFFRNCVLNRDFSSRKLTGSLAGNSHDILSLLIKALSKLSISDNASFLLTNAKDFIFHQRKDDNINIRDYSSFEYLLAEGDDYDYYYIRSNLLTLILHFKFFNEKNKTLLINQEIMNQDTKGALRTFLEKRNIKFEIGPHDVILKKIAQEHPTVLVIESVNSNNIQNATLHEPGLNLSTVQFARQINGDRQSRPIFKLYPESYYDIKLNQFNFISNKIPENEYLERVNIGIDNYLNWHEQNISGSRFLSRFSHFHHGTSGRVRAVVLKKRIENFLNRESNDSFRRIKQYIRQALSASSSTCHSLSRFVLCQLLKINEGFHQVPDKHCKKFKNSITL